MTPRETREAAAVILAFADGKKIQRRLRLAYEEWENSDSPIRDWQFWEYRIAPEPWTGKIWVKGDNTAIYRESHDADEWRNEGYRLIAVKEVGDE